jgi:hypothetical protein
MSRFLLIAGIILALFGFVIGLQRIYNPGVMDLYSLTGDVAATFLTGGLLIMGLGSLLERLGNLALGRLAGVDDDETVVMDEPARAVVPAYVPPPAPVVPAPVVETPKTIDDLPPLRRFGASAITPPPVPSGPPIAMPPPIAAPVAVAIESEAEIETNGAAEASRFRLPGFRGRTGSVPGVSVTVAETPAPPPPPPAPPPQPVERSAAEELLSRVPHTTRRIISSSEAASHRVPGVIVRNVAAGAAVAATTATVTGVSSGVSSTGATGKSVAETLDALEQAKTEIRTAFDRAPVPAPVPEVEEEMPGPEEDEFEEDDIGDDASDVDFKDGELYVVEELTVRNHPARILSDGTVEAETDEGWMRFENMEHLNEYLDAA